MEQTLIIIKPDAVNRCLVGEIIKRFEDKGLKIVGLKMTHLKQDILHEHYKHHKDKDFFEELVEYMSSIPSIVMVLEGKEVVDVTRKMIGPTLGREAEPGTIRGDYSMSTQANIIHASENVEIARQEIKRFFKEDEIYEYEKMNLDWVYSKTEKE